MINAEARGAWSELESHLRPYLARRVPSAADVDDLLQEIFVKLHQALPDLRDSERFGGWVYRIAKSVVANRARAQARQPVLHFPTAADAEGGALSDGAPDQDQLQLDLGRCVALFVGRLPSPYREAITLTELQGLSQQEAADLLGVSLSGMKSRVQRGREKIRHMFDECCQISVDCRGHVFECEPRARAEVPGDCRNPAVSWAARGRRA